MFESTVPLQHEILRLSDIEEAETNMHLKITHKWKKLLVYWKLRLTFSVQFLPVTPYIRQIKSEKRQLNDHKTSLPKLEEATKKYLGLPFLNTWRTALDFYISNVKCTLGYSVAFVKICQQS